MKLTLEDAKRMMEENGGSLDLRDTSITALPEGLTVGRYLDLRRTPITALPEGLKVGGYLDLEGTQITALPEGLAVGRMARSQTYANHRATRRASGRRQSLSQRYADHSAAGRAYSRRRPLSQPYANHRTAGRTSGCEAVKRMKKRETSKTLAGVILAGDLLLSLATLGRDGAGHTAGFHRRASVSGRAHRDLQRRDRVRTGQVF